MVSAPHRNWSLLEFHKDMYWNQYYFWFLLMIYLSVLSSYSTIRLQEDINSLHSWVLPGWWTLIYLSTTYSMNISQSRTNFISTQYYLDNRSLTVIDHSKYLGVVLQSNLNWTKYIEEKVAKANTTLAMIIRNLNTSFIQTKDLHTMLLLNHN